MAERCRAPRRFLAALVLAPVAVISWPLQQQPSRPTIRSGINVVPLDVRVVDRDGRPVTDLKQGDFTILEDGVEQPIRLFSTHTYVADPSAIIPEPIFRQPAGPDLAPQNRRVFLIMLGRGRHQTASEYVDALAEFVGERVLPQDLVALLAWNRATDFTTDHELLQRTIIRFRDRHEKIEVALREWFRGLRAIYGSKDMPRGIQQQIDAVFEDADAIRPRPVPPAQIADAASIDKETRRIRDDLLRNQQIQETREAGFTSLRDTRSEVTAAMTDLTFEEYAAQMAVTMQDLGNLYAGIEYLRHLEGEKHLVLVTENGMSLPQQDSHVTLARATSDARIALDIIQTGGVAGPPQSGAAGVSAPRSNPWLRGEEILAEVMASPNRVYAETFAIQDLRLMADQTGGQLHAFRTGQDAFNRLDETTRFQYLLGYYPSNPSWDGTFRQVTVRVKRPNLQVVCRRGYFASERLVPLDRREFVTFSRIQAAGVYNRIVEDIKVKLGEPAVTGAGMDRALSVGVTVDISRVKVTREDDRHVGSLDVALFFGDARQTVVDVFRHRVDFRLDDALRERLLHDGVSFSLGAPLAPEARFLKVVVYDYGADLLGTATAKVPR